MDLSVEHRVIHSALWAAYGDALGFISELADERGLRQRLRNSPVLLDTLPWVRRIGGKFGADIELPAGCYSDDTQLRLATSRAIRGNGLFDVEAFTKVELPVWLSYQLGGGRGTKAAATSLTRRSNGWLKNFFDRPTRYIDSGGNGAAMRIQPHVWASAPQFDANAYSRDVIRNSITTHGHVRGFVGALLHADLLAETLRTGSLPHITRWQPIIESLSRVCQIIAADDQLVTFWLPTWEKASGQSIQDAVKTVISECLSDVNALLELVDGPFWSYRRILEALDAFSPDHRGSGTRTVLAALALSWLFRSRPQDAIREAAQMLGSDTDSIATMAGALLGATVPFPPSGKVMDSAYIRREASRLARIKDSAKDTFVYPNLLRWTPPTAASQTLGIVDGGPVLAGLGRTELVGETVSAIGRSSTIWQWMKLEFGQTILVQRKPELPALRRSVLPNAPAATNRVGHREIAPQAELFGTPTRGTSMRVSTRTTTAQEYLGDASNNQNRNISIDDATTRVLNSRFDPTVLGEMFLAVSQGDNSIELAVAFAAIIAKARAVRLARRENDSGTQPRELHKK